MNIYIADKIKSLRVEKGISQEKLAQYLNVSFQSVSKWENGNTYPDISLLPEIARFFGITVDELLQVKKIDEQKLFAEYEEKACNLFQNGDWQGALEIWQEAYHRMPNNIAVKEMLMSTYYDLDKIKYKKEIIELGTELYNASLLPEADNTNALSNHSCTYYRGQAIEQISKTYAVNGEQVAADEWAEKSSFLMHCQEFLFTEITHGNDLLTYFRFANYHYFKHLFYMACRVGEDKELSEKGYGLEIDKALSNLYETVYPDGDAEFEMLAILCMLNHCIAEDEAKINNDEQAVKQYLTKALWYAKKSISVKSHKLENPLFKGFEIADAPTDNIQIVRKLKDKLSCDCFANYKDKEWFIEILQELNAIT